MGEMVKCFACDKPATMQISTDSAANGACDRHRKDFWKALRANIKQAAR